MSRSNSRYRSNHDDRWPDYVPVAERRRKAALAMEKLRKKGHPVAPVKIEGRTIVTTFWGKAWCDNLERYRDYENRIERGRAYVRNGSVVDLQIAPREVTAMVSGSELYKVTVSIGEVKPMLWASICKDCAGGIDSLVELLQGRLAKGVMDRICRQGDGLFPRPAEIHFSCSCLDHASMCKHVAAVLYGVGARLDTQPELLFRLRAVDEKDLVIRLDTALPLAKQGQGSGKILDSEDLSALFGLDMDAATAPEGRQPPAASQKPARSGPSGDRHQSEAMTIRPRPTTPAKGGNRAATGRIAADEPPTRSPVRSGEPTKAKVVTKTVRTRSEDKRKVTTPS